MIRSDGITLTTTERRVKKRFHSSYSLYIIHNTYLYQLNTKCYLQRKSEKENLYGNFIHWPFLPFIMQIFLYILYSHFNDRKKKSFIYYLYVYTLKY